MATIAENLERIQSAKTDIKTAIESKGVTVPSSATIDTYATYVSQISGGGGIPMPSNLSAATFNANGNITSLTFTASTVGDNAYEYCNKITNVTLTSGVTSIGHYAFSDCSSLTSINIPSGVTSIGNYTFQSCNNLPNINIPSGVTSIGEGTFNNCSSLTNINIPSGVTSIGDIAFQYCSSLTSISIPSGVTSIGGYAFNNCTSLTSITVNASLPPTLGEDVFGETNDCPIYVPSGSVSDYQEAWGEYELRIQAMPSPSSYKWVATYTGGATTSAECDTTFAIASGEIDLTNLESVEIGDCVTSIGNDVFSGCSSLTSCTIGSGVTVIDSGVFYDTNTAMTLTIYATTPPTLGGHIFMAPNGGIFVPAESVNAYKSAQYWSAYAAGIQPIPNS